MNSNTYLPVRAQRLCFWKCSCVTIVTFHTPTWINSVAMRAELGWTDHGSNPTTPLEEFKSFNLYLRSEFELVGVTQEIRWQD